MSQTTTPVVPTALQPHFALSNIIEHPGSTYAGIGVVLGIIAQAINAGGMPTTIAGWITLIAGVAISIAAALGK
jgi:hypothetical protein